MISFYPRARSVRLWCGFSKYVDTLPRLKFHLLAIISNYDREVTQVAFNAFTKRALFINEDRCYFELDFTSDSVASVAAATSLRLTEGSPRQSAYSFSELRLIEALEAGALKINLCALGDCATGSLSESRVRAVEEMLS